MNPRRTSRPGLLVQRMRAQTAATQTGSAGNTLVPDRPDTTPAR